MQYFCRPHSNKPQGPTRKPPWSASLDTRKRRRGTSDQTMFGPERADRYIRYILRISSAFWSLSKPQRSYKTNSYGVVATPRRPRESESCTPFGDCMWGEQDLCALLIELQSSPLLKLVLCEGVKKFQVPQDFFM